MGDSYNKFEVFPELPYNCISYLIQNSELVWKLLAYNDANAWKNDEDHPSLTQSQKGALIYDGVQEQSKYRVFMTTNIDPAWVEQVCQLRISVVEAWPTNHIYGQVLMGMEIYPHSQVSQLSNYRTRADVMAQELIRVFNGAEINGLGKLFFDLTKNYRCRMTTIGVAPFIGKALVFANWVA